MAPKAEGNSHTAAEVQGQDRKGKEEGLMESRGQGLAEHHSGVGPASRAGPIPEEGVPLRAV